MNEITIRDFRPGDADACFRIRSDGFIQRLSAHLSPRETAGCVNAYMPADLVRMNNTMQTFVALEKGQITGFCTVDFISPLTAEILFLYVTVDRHGRGVGSRLLRHAEDWLREHRPEITDLVLDTVVPVYNGPFYEKMGFSVTHEREIDRGGTKIPAVQMAKNLRTQSRD
jgi:GNAT superfamily N-acetyltransferase